jgi:hypothetical protein
MAEPQPDSSSAGIQRVREAAKYLIAALAALGAILVSGLSLTNLGEAREVWQAILATVLAVFVIVLIIAAVVDILMPVEVSIRELAARELTTPDDPVVAYVNGNPALLMGRTSIAAVRDEYEAALVEWKQASDAYFGVPSTANEKRRDLAEKKANTAGEVVDLLLGINNYKTHRLRFENSLPPIVFGALLLTALIGWFAWASSKPAEPKQHVPDFRGADLRNVDLSGANLLGANLQGLDLTDTNFLGANLAGAKIDRQTVWRHTTCPDGANSDNSGATCAGHLVPIETP